MEAATSIYGSGAIRGLSIGLAETCVVRRFKSAMKNSLLLLLLVLAACAPLTKEQRKQIDDNWPKCTQHGGWVNRFEVEGVEDDFLISVCKDGTSVVRYDPNNEQVIPPGIHDGL